MKNEAKLQRLIRKIVKEELANLHQKPTPSHPEFGDAAWGMFDEPFEPPPRELEHQSDFAHDLPDWCDSVQTEELSSHNLSPQKRRKRKKR